MLIFIALIVIKENPVSIGIDIVKEIIESVSLNTYICGTWEQIDIDGTIDYMAAIDEDSITIYANDEEKSHLYWVGDFDSYALLYNKDITYLSKNYLDITKDIKNASHILEKEFTYSNRAISLSTDFNGEYRDITLRRTNKYDLPIVKIPNFETRKSGFNNTKNQEICNYIIKYPSYFDATEENSKENIIDNNNEKQQNLFSTLIEEDDKKIEEMFNNDFIVKYPSDNSAYAEIFIGSYKNVKVNNFEDLKKIAFNSENAVSETSYLLSTTGGKINDLDAIMNIYTTTYISPTGNDPPIYGLAYETWIYLQDTDEVIDLGMSYGMNDTSEYDYISDYKLMLNSLKKK